ncbi:spindle pole body component [Hirsutella rhossiliensis]|uniref:Spindle pole body component n=1 Tax=Hirsutella rhossiliensis TaxID=111463 RepID=A0A9P8N2Y3_9HYPO|nr:spc97 / spc98 family domain-containing protein [Hirsutella rhossiliensis]KAH0965647.1 spc97 / spc98 family domain-containing protein [Hirsutella rhossiliensis]
MARGDPEADVFAVPDFWQTSKWLQQVIQDAPPTLFTTDLGGLPGNPPFRVALQQEGFFKLPSLCLVEPKQTVTQPEQQCASTASTSSSSTEDAQDVWIDTAEPSDDKVSFRTWDAFKTTEFAVHQPMFVSEAGPAAYDALLRQAADPPELQNSDAAIVEARTYISCLLALALGRDSIFFKKDNKLQTFHPALPSFRISGYSRQVLEGIESQALRCGGSFLQLSAFVRSAYAKNSSRCEVALASSISHVLQAVEQRLAVDGIKPRSLLQLQASIRDVSTALAPPQRLVSRLRQEFSDEEILSLIFHMASSLDDGQGFVRVIVREMLRRVSAPWIELLEEWIGTKREEGIPLSKSCVGESRGFVKVEAETYVDDFGREVEDVDFRLDHTKVPDFMPSDVVESMFETGRNLRFIRSFHPNHPLAQQAVIESTQPPKAEWLYDWASILELERRTARYRDNLYEVLRASRRDSWSRTHGIGAVAPAPSSTFQLDFFGLDQHGMEEKMLASIKQLDQPMTGPKGEDSLSELLRERLFDMHGADMDRADATPHWSLLSVLSFGGIASAQAQIVNRESLRLLFDAHDIRGQLRLQRDFHLFGNGMFCSRLSHALFDPDLTSAERQAGIARQGVMGLRLGGRDAWPPASSELRLVLMGVLTESHASRDSSSFSLQTGDSSLPGDLSFAVRDLSTEEIDKCMNPDSLEALDFLRLSYKTPAELSGIITPIHLMHYDRIFKLLLRVLRMQYVTNQHCLSVKAQGDSWQCPNNASLRFNREAHHFVSSVASYFLDVGVAIPWQMFEQRMGQVRADLEDGSGDVSTKKLQSPNELRELHSQVLDRIMFALFLRKRQQPVLKLLEELFSIVLRYAKHARLEALGRGGETEEKADAAELYAEFKKKMQVFLTVCRGVSEKGRAGSGKAYEELGVGEDSLVAQLLMKLDMGHFYVAQFRG